MNEMELSFAGPSPFARKVRALIIEAGLQEQVTMTEVAGTPVDPGSIKLSHNPLGKIPSLARPDGPTLYDSRVITRYLDDLAGGGFYPAAPRLWDCLVLEATGDGIMEAAVLQVYEHRVRPADLVYDVWLEAQWGKVARAISAVEDLWMPYLAGPFDMAQMGICVALDYVDFRLPEKNWRSSAPQLAAWHSDVRERPALVETRPE